MTRDNEEKMSAPILTIVVPAYRARFLGEALDSIAAQTDQRFQVYVFDDGSRDDLEAIFSASPLAGRANAQFHRFDQNAGRTSLVAHWNRCVQRTGDQPWVWLFSDDDVADSRCVGQFYDALESGRLTGSVCRFNTMRIDQASAITGIHPPHPPSESASSFAYHRLSFQRRSFAPDHIFRRAAFTANGGFVDFPFALGSDDASWIAFAGKAPIVTLDGAIVYWRFTGENMSLLQEPNTGAQLLALADFTCWMQEHFRAAPSFPENESRRSRIDLPALARAWFRRTLWNMPPTFPFFGVPGFARELQRKGLGDRWSWTVRIAYVLLVVKLHAIVRGLGDQAAALLGRPARRDR